MPGGEAQGEHRAIVPGRQNDVPKASYSQPKLSVLESLRAAWPARG